MLSTSMTSIGRDCVRQIPLAAFLPSFLPSFQLQSLVSVVGFQYHNQTSLFITSQIRYSHRSPVADRPQAAACVRRDSTDAGSRAAARRYCYCRRHLYLCYCRHHRSCCRNPPSAAAAAVAAAAAGAAGRPGRRAVAAQTAPGPAGSERGRSQVGSGAQQAQPHRQRRHGTCGTQGGGNCNY